MSIQRMVVVGLLGAIFVGGASVSSASALCCLWLIELTALFVKPAQGETEAKMELVEARSETSADFTSTLTGGVKVVVLCKKFEPTLGEILEPAENVATGSRPKLEFKECTVDEPATCKVKEPIVVEPTSSELFADTTSEGEELFAEVKPTTGTTFASVTITGCSGEGIYKVTGSACALVLGTAVAEADEEILLQEFVKSPLPATEELCKLKFGTAEATFETEVEFLLDGSQLDKKWRADIA